MVCWHPGESRVVNPREGGQGPHRRLRLVANTSSSIPFDPFWRGALGQPVLRGADNQIRSAAWNDSYLRVAARKTG